MKRISILGIFVLQGFMSLALAERPKNITLHTCDVLLTHPKEAYIVEPYGRNRFTKMNNDYIGIIQTELEKRKYKIISTMESEGEERDKEIAKNHNALLVYTSLREENFGHGTYEHRGSEYFLNVMASYQSR